MAGVAEQLRKGQGELVHGLPPQARRQHRHQQGSDAVRELGPEGLDRGGESGSEAIALGRAPLPARGGEAGIEIGLGKRQGGGGFGLRPAMRAILEIPAAQQEEVLALAAATAAANASGNAALADGTAPALALGSTGVVAGEVASLAAPAGGVAGMIEDLADKLARSPQKRLEQMIETDEAQAAEILKRWLLREAA